MRGVKFEYIIYVHADLQKPNMKHIIETISA